MCFMAASTFGKVCVQNKQTVGSSSSNSSSSESSSKSESFGFWPFVVGSSLTRSGKSLKIISI